MPKGISLHVGINSADSDAFPTVAHLVGCENDARAMHELAGLQHFSKRVLLLGPEATYDRVKMEINAASAELKAGDIFLFTFAGHGSGKFDSSHDETDNQDETILLFDRMLLDDVLEGDFWVNFESGVRVLMIADSCHSGTVSFLLAALTRARQTELLLTGDFEMSATTDVEVMTADFAQARTISEAARDQHLEAFGDFYEKVLEALPSPAPPIKAGVLLLAACGDKETTADGDPHGAFTQALLDVWNGGNFAGTYKDFVTEISGKFPGQAQHPALTFIGQSDFSDERPFII
ncbi:MAG TPA: caspase family protein [Pyrinomonadaceae bacterium]|nr:caspase family protein [Pyrinomonadaceae bacterium]